MRVAGIIVQSLDDPPAVRELAPGEAVTFGRGSPQSPVGIALPDPAI